MEGLRPRSSPPPAVGRGQASSRGAGQKSIFRSTCHLPETSSVFSLRFIFYFDPKLW